MALQYSTTNIHNKLGDLTLDSLPEQVDSGSDHERPYADKSLLTKSLAGEKYPSTALQLQTFLIDELTSNLTDEHPEPELLATSVGKDSDGRLIPLSSTISLLSLSNNTGSVATNYLEFPMFAKQAPPPAVQPVPPVMDRKNSYNNMRSRNSLTHLHQQRLQPYQKLTSPTIGSSAEFTTLTSPQTIPTARSQGFMTPDLPNLDPTSIGGSPSRFWLSSQTPPRSLLNSLSKSRTHIFPLTQLHSQPQQAVPTAPMLASVGSINSVSKAIDISKNGSDSPVLNPVQTPLEDFPMTPLFLNGGGDHYFVLTNGQGTNNQPTSREFQLDEFDETEENMRGDDDESMMDAPDDV